MVDDGRISVNTLNARANRAAKVRRARRLIAMKALERKRIFRAYKSSRSATGKTVNELMAEHTSETLENLLRRVIEGNMFDRVA